MPLLDAIEKAGGRVVLNATEAGERSLWSESPLDQAQPAVGTPAQSGGAERSVYAAEAFLDQAGQDSPVTVSVPEFCSVNAALLPLLARGCLANCVDVFQRPNTRLYDWLNHDPAALVRPKDPRDFAKRLRFHRQVKSAAEDGL